MKRVVMTMEVRDDVDIFALHTEAEYMWGEDSQVCFYESVADFREEFLGEPLEEPLPDLLESHGGDAYYVGPLQPALALAKRDRRVVLVPMDRKGLYGVEFREQRDDEAVAEWGCGTSAEAAMRYALGAYFGPLDEDYDQAWLRAALKSMED